MVVGIGCSAGGLAALKVFFAHMPGDTDMAFVVVVHLSPDRESMLADLLQPHMEMPVQQVTETVKLVPNHVYVIPPNANLNSIDTHLRLSPLEEKRQSRAPIDHFLRTLAQTHDGSAIGIILTGTGSDGSQGVREIKARHGLVVVQDPGEAEYDGMPRNAIATGMVDLVLPLGEIPGELLKFARTRPQVPLPREGEEVGDHERQLLHKVFALLRARTGRDFSGYKRSTILRRIARRMQLRHVEELSTYLGMLRNEPDETQVLADDVLITVTDFFRDPNVFDMLQRDVLPGLFDGRASDDTLRVWVVGCSTGEEAYSMAILLLEEASRRTGAPRLQVFASDLHQQSLHSAREGFYLGEIADTVSPERLRRYFQEEEGGYRVRKEVREMVVFAPHNLLGDPPFSRLDLISCRNLLIYLQREIQRDVIQLFHYSLRTDGYLLLGSSETIDGSEYFLAEDKKLCLYRKRNIPVPEPRLPVFPVTRSRMASLADRSYHPGEAVVYGVLHHRMVERYAPPSLLLSSDDRIVHLSQHAGRYLVHPGGEMTANALMLVREELRMELRTMLLTVRERGEAVDSRPIPVHFDGELRPVALHARPALEPEQSGFVLVMFDERQAEGEDPPADVAVPETQERARIRELEADLEMSRQRFQAVIEEYETAQEEMKAANEELQSTNEELRSTMEELETSKEELQSMNEELQTVNQENRHRVEELAQLSSDLQNLLAATDIATLFLDRELRIMRFTPKISELFNIRMTDRSRPISDITHRLGYRELITDAQAVLDRLVPIVRETRDDSGRWYLTRVLAYRSSDDRIAGIVITFVEITERKRAEEALRASEERLQMTLRAAEAGAWQFDLGSGLSLLDESARGIFGIGAGPADQEKMLQLVHPEDRQRLSDIVAGYVGNRIVGSNIAEDYRIMRNGGEVRWVHARGKVFYRNEGGDRRCAGAAGVVLDVTDRKMAEEMLRQTDRRKEVFLATLAHELRNPLAALRNGLSLLEIGAGRRDAVESARQMMQRQVLQLVRLIDDLLDVSRICEGKLELRRQRVELRAVLQQSLEGCQDRLSHRQLEVDLPSEPVLLEADPVRLTQAFTNLLDNACKFTNEGGRIRVAAERIDDKVLVSVLDDGDGIPPENAIGIFQMFSRAPQLRDRSHDGLGLGLSLVKRLVEMHGGSVEVRSEGAGKGSEFRVLLPVVDTRPGARAKAGAPAGVATVTGLRILVVDDNEDAARSLAMLLEAADNEVQLAFDGEVAVRTAEAMKPDAALLDIGLPGLDGYELARRIRQQPWGAKIALVAVTGWLNEESSAQQALAAGFDRRLIKPVEPQGLMRVLAELLAARTDVDAAPR